MFATGNVETAKQAAENEFRARFVGELLLPEERRIIEQDIEWTRRAVEKYAHYYQTSAFRVLWPEVKFLVPLPNTEHHCYFVHRILHPDLPFPCSDDRCIVPHYLIGKTDAVMEWERKVWLLEHKTTSITGDIFYNRFWLDIQPTGYIYGIWKSTGVRPAGFLLSVVKKPNKRASDQLAVDFEREPYLRSDADLAEFETDIVRIAEDYEHAAVTNRWYRNTHACTSWNRRCYFIEVCKRNQEIVPDEFRTRELDYAQLAYYQILGLTPPEVKETPDAEIDSIA